MRTYAIVDTRRSPGPRGWGDPAGKPMRLRLTSAGWQVDGDPHSTLPLYLNRIAGMDRFRIWQGDKAINAAQKVAKLVKGKARWRKPKIDPRALY
jgi:hypothetical protein